MPKYLEAARVSPSCDQNEGNGEMATFPRRKYLIDFRSQGPFMLKMGSVWAGGIILLCLLLYYFADEELGRSFYSIHQRLRNTWRILLPAVLFSGGLSFLITIGVTVFIALRESHRLGGPIFKFNKLFRELEAGVLHTDFRFRNGDLLFDMGESYRSALQANRDRIIALQELSAQAEKLNQEMELDLLSHSLPAEEAEKIRETARLVSRIREAAAAFDVGAK